MSKRSFFPVSWEPLPTAPSQRAPSSDREKQSKKKTIPAVDLGTAMDAAGYGREGSSSRKQSREPIRGQEANSHPRNNSFVTQHTIRTVTPDQITIPEDESTMFASSPPRMMVHLRESPLQSRQTRLRAGSHAERGQSSAARDITSRPRTHTMDRLGSREVSPSGVYGQHRGHRHGVGSVNSTTSTASYTGIDDAITSIGHPSTIPADQLSQLPPQRPVTSRKGSSRNGLQGMVHRAPPTTERYSEPPPPTEPEDLPAPDLAKMYSLMQSTRGRMEGSLAFRRGESSHWAASHCSINDEAGSLVYETKNADQFFRTLVPDLRGCHIAQAWDPESQMLYLDVMPQTSRLNVHLRPHTRDEFELWFAALMCWHPMKPKGIGDRMTQASEMKLAGPPSVHSRRQSEQVGHKEAPVIKIGKMIYWETGTSHSLAGTPRNSYNMSPQYQDLGSRRWQRVSCRLRENGELKLFAEKDQEVVATVQLSRLCRYAVQRLDPSVFDSDFSIAIYPQYSAFPERAQNQQPVFVSLESRVLFEVWLVLLRAFTIPQLYGSKQSLSPEGGKRGRESERVVSGGDMFRVERTLSVRVGSAKLSPPMSPTLQDRHPPMIRGKQGEDGGSEGYFVEVLLDGEIRAKTSSKPDSPQPSWQEEFEFDDMPPVVSVASVVLKKRPPHEAQTERQIRDQQKRMYDVLTAAEGGGDAGDGFIFDQTCGRIDIYLDDLEPGKELQKWWTMRNQYGQAIGEVNVRISSQEQVILMAKDYKPLSEILHDFINGLTLQMGQCLSNDLKRLSEALLSIFQVSGSAFDWLTSLVEEEIDGTFRESSAHSRFRISRRIDSNDAGEGTMFGPPVDRELLVRDMGKNATVEANLLFRGNTLLTKSLDAHMKRLGKEYLEETLGEKLKEIADQDADCEVDPNRITNANELDRNWRRLIRMTEDVWNCIAASASRCPTELRHVFRHIRACAEDRYGDFLRTVSYSSVSGFLFLRFFGPAILNPNLFGLVKDVPKLKARRAFTLIAKSIQTFANMSNFGAKEPWMEPMNAFLGNHRSALKRFLDDICAVNASSEPQDPMPPSYSTPLQILQRLPDTSKEGFPSLPYLIDHARSHAALVSLWMEHVKDLKILEQDGDIWRFHRMCISLDRRTKECLANAERAERPSSLPDQKWAEMAEDIGSQKSKKTNGGSKAKGSQWSPDSPNTARQIENNDALSLQMPPSSSRTNSKARSIARPQSRGSGKSSPDTVDENECDFLDTETDPRSTADEDEESSIPENQGGSSRLGYGTTALSFAAQREIAKVRQRERLFKDKESMRAQLRGGAVATPAETAHGAPRQRSASSGAIAGMGTPNHNHRADTSGTPQSANVATSGRNKSIGSVFSNGNPSSTSDSRPFFPDRKSSANNQTPVPSSSLVYRDRQTNSSRRHEAIEPHIVSALHTTGSSSTRNRDAERKRRENDNSPTPGTASSSLPARERESSARHRNKRDEHFSPGSKTYNDEGEVETSQRRTASVSKSRARSSSRDQLLEREREKERIKKAAYGSSRTALERKRSVQELAANLSGMMRSTTPTPRPDVTRTLSSNKDSTSPYYRRGYAKDVDTLDESTSTSFARPPEQTLGPLIMSKPPSRAASPFSNFSTNASPSPVAPLSASHTALSSFFSAAGRRSRPGSRSASQAGSRPASRSRPSSRGLQSRPESRFGTGGTGSVAGESGLDDNSADEAQYPSQSQPSQPLSHAQTHPPQPHSYRRTIRTTASSNAVPTSSTSRTRDPSEQREQSLQQQQQRSLPMSRHASSSHGSTSTPLKSSTSRRQMSTSSSSAATGTTAKTQGERHVSRERENHRSARNQYSSAAGGAATPGSGSEGRPGTSSGASIAGAGSASGGSAGGGGGGNLFGKIGLLKKKKNAGS